MQLLGCKRIRTTAYHPCANGLVERFHRQLKTALKAIADPNHWMKALPLVLLGIRTSLKQDIKCTSAELVYGTTLRLPGEFFHSSDKQKLDPISYVDNLKAIMQQLKPPAVRSHTLKPCYVSHDLNSCTHVFVRHDAVKTPLQQPYDGPFKVIKRQDKHFTLEVKGKNSVVSIDRLKPAYLETSEPIPKPPDILPCTISPTSPPHKTTSSGRHVRWPKRLIESPH